MSQSATDRIIVDLEVQIEKKKGIIGNKGLVSKLPDKGQRIKDQIVELEQRIESLKNGSPVDTIMREEKKVIPTVHQQAPLNTQNKPVAFKKKEHATPEELIDQLFRTHISNEQVRLHNKPRDVDNKFLLKPSPPIQLEHEKNKQYQPEKKEFSQPQLYTEQDEILLKGKRGMEYEKSHNIKQRSTLMLAPEEGLDLYRKHIQYMDDFEENRMMNNANQVDQDQDKNNMDDEDYEDQNQEEMLDYDDL
ncbi:CHR24 [Acrasis kona]|uniref:CHR24 n=1 Tax=Acrasis kona TaxID=1008807 RepID=A0AAW2Z4U7_9EUKA